jgi:hypothetical protein
MKPTILSLLWIIFALNVCAKEPTYREALQALHDRFAKLEMERHDYRKPEPRLTAEEEQERVRLHGQLLRDDPVWVLIEQMLADIRALEELRTKTEADSVLIETLKDLLAGVAGFSDRATSRAQAEEDARALRQFVVRRDVEGLRAWSKSQR